jgi:hypothetical protein
MTASVDRGRAEAILREEAGRAEDGPIDKGWEAKVERLSQLCDAAGIRTHIAFLGTAMLARAASQTVDLMAFKPTQNENNANAYSARVLCHSVLVPLAAELGISLGVTGREPLNNQPYFRMTRLDDGTPIHGASRAGFDYMCTLVKELQALSTEVRARSALRAFVAVRRRYQVRYPDQAGEAAVSPEALRDAIRRFVAFDSEGGRRAQAVVAGLMDVFAGPDRVESGRINDPSRKYPGDVCVRSLAKPEQWEKAIEVRDKSVSDADIRIFGKKCIDMGVREAAVVLASESQTPIDVEKLKMWANTFELGLTLYLGWTSFVDQVLFWSELPKPLAASRAVGFIQERLVGVEASPKGIRQWVDLTHGLSPPDD